MKRKFFQFLLICMFVNIVLHFTDVGASLRIKRAYYGYLTPNDRKYHEIQAIQHKNQMRVDAAIADLRRNAWKYSRRKMEHQISQMKRLDLSKPDALDGMTYFTKNSLYRYRVNKSTVKSVKERVTSMRFKCLNIYEGAIDAFLNSRRKLLDLVGSSWRRSYIVPNEEFRPPITFS